MAQDQMQWEVLDQAYVSRDDMRPFISLQLRGTFQVNRAAYEKLGRPNAVKLLYDRTKRVVGFIATDLGERGAFKVRKSGNAESYQVAAKSLINNFDLDVQETQRYEARMYGDVLGIDLNTPYGKSNRGRPAARREQEAP
ncbi:MAG: hypothetical protein ACR2JW_02745 [Thermomicrobiales bacterium]